MKIHIIVQSWMQQDSLDSCSFLFLSRKKNPLKYVFNCWVFLEGFFGNITLPRSNKTQSRYKHDRINIFLRFKHFAANYTLICEPESTVLLIPYCSKRNTIKNCKKKAFQICCDLTVPECSSPFEVNFDCHDYCLHCYCYLPESVGQCWLLLGPWCLNTR